jgi:hypothetical protein
VDQQSSPDRVIGGGSDAGNSTERVPEATLQATIGARIDRLDRQAKRAL